TVVTNSIESPHLIHSSKKISDDRNLHSFPTRRSSDLIFYSTGYSLNDYEQAKARIHRIGQTKKVTYIHLIAQDTVDQEVVMALADRKSTRLNSSHVKISYAVFCLKKKIKNSMYTKYAK